MPRTTLPRLAAGLTLLGSFTLHPSSLLFADPPATTTAPAAAADPNAAAIDALLDTLDARGKTLADFTADLKLTTIDNSLGDESARLGHVAYQRLPDGQARLRIVFDQKILGDNPPKNEKLEYLLAGGWLIERDYRLKKEISRQVARPGEKMNLLKLGEGPFPLPLGQDKREVHKLFEVKLLPAASDDPAHTAHLQLLPRPNTQFSRKFQSIDVWVAADGGMPIRIQTTDRNGATTTTTDLSHLQVNTSPPAATFTLDKLPEGWQRIDEPFSE
jgi:hypothetical protein